MKTGKKVFRLSLSLERDDGALTGPGPTDGGGTGRLFTPYTTTLSVIRWRVIVVRYATGRPGFL